MSRFNIAMLGGLSLIPMACVGFIVIWPPLHQRRWAEEFEREHGYDPYDPSLNWRDVPVVEEASVALETIYISGWVGLVGLLIAVALIIYFSRAAFGSETIDRSRARAWLAALIIGNVIAFPIAWYRFLWKNRDDEIGDGNTAEADDLDAESARPDESSPDEPRTLGVHLEARDVESLDAQSAHTLSSRKGERLDRDGTFSIDDTEGPPQ